MSQQLTWTHFVELIPIEDNLKRDFTGRDFYNNVLSAIDDRVFGAE